MNIWNHDFECGDVVKTGLGDARLIQMIGEDEQGRDTWQVHYLDLDIELEHAFVDDVYEIVEVAG